MKEAKVILFATWILCVYIYIYKILANQAVKRLLFDTLLAQPCNWSDITHSGVQCCTAVALWLCRYRNSVLCYKVLWWKANSAGFLAGKQKSAYTFFSTETQCPEVHYHASTTIFKKPVSSIIIAVAHNNFHTVELHRIQVLGTLVQLQAWSHLLPHPYLQFVIPRHPGDNFPDESRETLILII